MVFPEGQHARLHAPGLRYRDRIEEYEAEGVRVLAASFDTPAENRRFAEEQRFPFPLLCDVDRRIGLVCRAALQKSDSHPRRIT